MTISTEEKDIITICKNKPENRPDEKEQKEIDHWLIKTL